MSGMGYAVRKQYLAIIPARGGSKRLPGKNLMRVGGVSLIGRAINSAKGVEGIREICVTTDDDAVATDAATFGPYVHFSRPCHLATDEAGTVDVVLHAIHWFEQRGRKFDAFILLQPTSPLRTEEHVRNAIRLYECNAADAVVSVCKVEHPIEWCAELGADGGMEPFGAQLLKHQRSQEFPTRYRINGAIYIYDVAEFVARKAFFYESKTIAYEMDAASSTDVDTMEDFLIASCLASCQEGNVA